MTALGPNATAALWFIGVAAISVRLRPEPDPAAASDRRSSPSVPLLFARVGAVTALLVVVLLSRSMMMAVLIGFGAWIVRHRSQQRHRHRRQQALTASLEPLLDLLHIAVASGANLMQALRIAAAEPGPLASTIDTACREFPDIFDVLTVIDEAVNEPTLRISAAVGTAWENGDALAPVMERLAHHTREHRRRHAEADARRAPIRALAPLLLTTLPAFVLLTVVPLLASGLQSLHLSPLDTP
jgi:Flp pilus assembly protein TadB